MDGLDLSGLTDDQLVALAQACCIEAMQRNPAAAQAMHDMMIGEAERARIARIATESEIAAARARERQRAAAEAVAAVRAQEALALADRAKAAAQQRLNTDRQWLSAAAQLVGLHPRDISIVHYHTARAHAVIINKGHDRFAYKHLARFDAITGSVSTTAALVRNKPALAGLLAELAVMLPAGTFLSGGDFQWDN